MDCFIETSCWKLREAVDFGVGFVGNFSVCMDRRTVLSFDTSSILSSGG